MTKTAEQQAWDLQCYGCSELELRQIVANDVGRHLTGNFNMLIAGILSDAQQVLEFGDAETARQYMNRAKYIIFNYLSKETEHA